MRITVSCDHEAHLDELVEVLTTLEGLRRLPPDLVDPTSLRAASHDHGASVSWRLRHAVGQAVARERLLSHAVDVDVEIDWQIDRSAAIGTIRTRVSGAPVRASAVHRIEACDGGCTSTIELDLNSRVPMLGGRLLASIDDTARDRVEDFLHALDAARGAHGTGTSDLSASSPDSR